MKVDVEMEGLENLEEILKNGAVAVQVGILEQENARSQSTVGNAQLGLIHEFGSRTKGINENSFLRMPLNTVFPKRLENYGLSDKQAILKELIDLGSLTKLGKKLGGIAVSVITEAFATSGFGTWANKHGPNERTGLILRDSSKLMKSITFKVVSKK